MRSAKVKHDNPADYFKQGVFVLVCVLVSVLIDQVALESLVNVIAPEWLPLEFFQVILLPIVLVIAAKWTGGSKKVRIAPPGSAPSKDKRR